MVITRKIEIYVHESDPDMKRNYMQTIYGWRDAIRRAANLVVSHKFVQQNVRDFRSRSVLSRASAQAGRLSGTMSLTPSERRRA